MTIDVLRPQFVATVEIDGIERSCIAQFEVEDDAVFVATLDLDGKKLCAKADLTAVNIAMNQMINKRNELARLRDQKEARKRQQQVQGQGAVVGNPSQ